jgi:murein DD-endopeptidase MepM/ murein hydrolase activator NlpD
VKSSTLAVLILWAVVYLIVVACMGWEFADRSAFREQALTEELGAAEARIEELERAVALAAAVPSIPIDETFLRWPMHPDDYKRFTSPIGRRESPIYGGQYANHKGMDISGVYLARIVCSLGGKVTDVYPPPDGYWKGHPTKGGYVEITSPGGIVTRYSHMQEVERRMWKIGAIVKAGEMIGRQGNTGLSFKSHLHFELLIDGMHRNPLRYMRGES